MSGGSERFCLEVARSLAPHHRVEILTTTARDFTTWTSGFHAGEDSVDGIRVLRFEVEVPRDPSAWTPPPDQSHGRRADEWVRRCEGPYAPSLVRHLRNNRHRYGLVIFFTFRHWTTWAGIKEVGGRAALAPTAEDDEALRFRVFDGVFSAARALLLLTPEEGELVRSVRPSLDVRACVSGMGVPLPPEDDAAVARFRSVHGLSDAEYLLYVGRIAARKGCTQLIEQLEGIARRGERPPLLLLAGDADFEIRERSWLRHIGYLGEAEKAAALRGAFAFVMPSPYESFSIATVEALAAGTPALVNAACGVLSGHCLRGQCGIPYSDGDELVEALAVLRRPSVRQALGRNGREYVARTYDPATVAERTREFVQSLVHAA
jgi:glycosyltransferase involved in cell wall biosynthesis